MEWMTQLKALLDQQQGGGQAPGQAQQGTLGKLASKGLLSIGHGTDAAAQASQEGANQAQDMMRTLMSMFGMGMGGM